MNKDYLNTITLMQTNTEILSISDEVPKRNRATITTATVVKKVLPSHSNNLLTWHQIFGVVCIFRQWMNSKHLLAWAWLWEREYGISSTARIKVRPTDIRTGRIPKSLQTEDLLNVCRAKSISSTRVNYRIIQARHIVHLRQECHN
jgi:hypothetical protein